MLVLFPKHSPWTDPGGLRSGSHLSLHVTLDANTPLPMLNCNNQNARVSAVRLVDRANSEASLLHAIPSHHLNCPPLPPSCATCRLSLEDALINTRSLDLTQDLLEEMDNQQGNTRVASECWSESTTGAAGYELMLFELLWAEDGGLNGGMGTEAFPRLCKRAVMTVREPHESG